MAHSLGDLNNSFEKLRSELRAIKYPQHHTMSLESFSEGLPLMFLPIIHHCLLEYSSHVANYITEVGFDLYSKSDLRFIESTYKLLLNQFTYKPAITVQQFFQTGFAERKILLCHDLC
jgi:centrosomal protein CEP44